MTSGETRTQRRRRQTHESLLDALFELSVDRGLAAVTVHDVVDEADVAVGTFYNHFESREAAIEELVDRLMSAGRERMESFDPARDDAALVLGEGIARFIRAIAERPRWAAFMAQVANSTHWPTGSMFTQVARVIRAGQETGVFESVNLAEQRALLMGGVMRTTMALAGTELGNLDPTLVIQSSLQVAGATPGTVTRVIETLELS